jgi:hypothetical protein
VCVCVCVCVSVCICVRLCVSRDEYGRNAYHHAVYLSDYWNGSTFIPKRPELPPYLTFLGSQTFGYVCAAPPVKQTTANSSAVDEDGGRDSRWQTADNRWHTADSTRHTADSTRQTSDSRQQTAGLTDNRNTEQVSGDRKDLRTAHTRALDDVPVLAAEST